MKRRAAPGLGRRIVRTVALTVLCVHALVFVLSFAVYKLADCYWPGFFTDDTALPTGADLALAALLAGVAVAVATVSSVRMVRRLVTPWRQVADGLQRVAEGDLSVRLEPPAQAWDEAAQLVHDFNAMTIRLQQALNDRAVWNAAIAHELRTPLTIIRGRLAGLADGVFPPSEPLFRRLIAQVDGLGTVIDDLRVLSLFESGRLPVAWQWMDAGVLLTDLHDLMAPVLAQAGLRLDTQACEARVAGDPVRVRQALMALLDNARKYAVPGVVRLEGCWQGDAFEWRVQDAGPGLPAEAAATVFDAFWQGAEAQRMAEQGHGLGLSVVRAIARAHGGEARCEPACGGGTVFVMAWPARGGPGLDA